MRKGAEGRADPFFTAIRACCNAANVMQPCLASPNCYASVNKAMTRPDDNERDACHATWITIEFRIETTESFNSSKEH